MECRGKFVLLYQNNMTSSHGNEGEHEKTLQYDRGKDWTQNGNTAGLRVVKWTSMGNDSRKGEREHSEATMGERRLRSDGPSSFHS